MPGNITPPTEAAAPVAATTEKKRPEKPDEAAFEAAKEKAKKEHKIAQDKFVCGPQFLYQWPHPLIVIRVRIIVNAY